MSNYTHEKNPLLTDRERAWMRVLFEFYESVFESKLTLKELMVLKKKVLGE